METNWSYIVLEEIGYNAFKVFKDTQIIYGGLLCLFNAKLAEATIS